MRKSFFAVSKAVVAVLATTSISFAALADGGAKFLGNITTSSQVRSDMGTYWNQLTNENGCKWGTIHSVDNSGKSKFNFNGFDSCENGYKWAKAQPGRTFKFHALIWGSQKPDFLCTKKNPGITKEKTKQYIVEWFDAVAAKFPDLEYIDVVNEAIWDGNNYHSGYSKPAQGAEGISTDDPDCGGTYIIPALGGDEVIGGKHQYNFVKTAFEMARERWPHAKLIYNDYNTLSWQMNEGIEMVKTLVANGAPIDFYGQQSHDCKGMSKSDFESKLTRIHNETGLPLLISEYDIGEADDQKQKNDYANQIPFMWETPWIGGITIWGYINGATWAANTGIMESDGRKRAAMVWLEEYFAKNLDKGQNDTGVKRDPEPQTPFGGQVAVIKDGAKIEAENYDEPGYGAGNNSYSVASSGNGNSDYRKGVGANLYNGGTGVTIGYNNTGNWYEYSVDVAEAGSYTVYVAVASEAGGAFSLSVDGKDAGSSVEVPATGNYTDYNKVSTKIDLTQGQHIIRLTVDKEYFDIDYMTFVKGDGADPEPIGGTDAIVKAPVKTLQYDPNALQDYRVIDMQGHYLGIMSAYGFKAAGEMLQHSSAVRASGVYFLVNRFTGEKQSVRVSR